MKLWVSRKIDVRRLFSFTLTLTFCIATSVRASAQQAESAGKTDQIGPNLADQYRASVQERRAEIQAYQESGGRIDDAIRALRNELAKENRKGRAKDLLIRIEQLSKRRSALEERIEKEQEVVSGADEAETVFYSLAAKDLMQQQEERDNELRSLDTQIAMLKRELNAKRGRQVKEKVLRGQIDELSRRREKMANQPAIRAQDLAEPEAVQAALARSVRRTEAARRKQLKSIQENVAELEQTLAREDRWARRKSIETQIAELKMKQHELGIDPLPARREKREAVDEPLQAIEVGLNTDQLERTRRAEVLDQRAAKLREKLQTENRHARRKSLRLQIAELERQKKAVGKPKEELLPPTGGFVGAPYGSAWDLDYEYQVTEKGE